MKNFSDISENLGTSKDKLVKKLSAVSGLDYDIILDIVKNKSLDDINKLFLVTIHTFESKIAEFNNLLNSMVDNTLVNKNDLILDFLNKCTSDIDNFNFGKVILYILYLKDSVNFNKIAQTLNVTKVLNENYKVNSTISLFESVGINPEFVKNGRVPIIDGINNGCEIQEEIRFYSDLKDMLSRNNKRWGYDIHTQNIYNQILLYLSNEIDLLTNKDNITTVDNNFEETIIQELLTGELNQMYKDINCLRPLISDIQTLVFDMLCIVKMFVIQNKEYLKFLNRKTIDEFDRAALALYKNIESSSVTSLIASKDITNIKIFDNLYSKEQSYFNNYTLTNIRPLTAIDALMIIKSCSADFNLTLRKYINVFVTKGLNTVESIKNVMMKSLKFNQFIN